MFIINYFQAEQRQQLTCQGTVTWKWDEQRKHKRQREREWGTAPLLFIVFLVHTSYVKQIFANVSGMCSQPFGAFQEGRSGVGIHTTALSTSLNAEK